MVLFRFCFVFLMLVSLTACQGTGFKSGQEYVEELFPIGQGSKESKSDKKKDSSKKSDKKKESSQKSQKKQDKVSSNTHPPNCSCQQNASTVPQQPPLENFDELPPPKKLLVNPLGDRAPLKRKPQELLIMSYTSNFGWS